jgi:hypothetical protein
MHILLHDEDHARRIDKIIKNFSHSFATYKEIYQSLLKNEKDLLTLKQDLFMLFILMHDLDFYLEEQNTKIGSFEGILCNLMPISGSELPHGFVTLYRNRHYPELYEVWKKWEDRYINVVLRESRDLIKPLNKIGHKITFEEKKLNVEEAFELNKQIRQELKKLFKAFGERYPKLTTTDKEN